MIVAGIGCRKGVTKDEVLAAIRAALAAHGLTINDISALATTAFKKDETGIFEAGLDLGLRVHVIEPSSSPSSGGEVDRTSEALLTHSTLSQTLAGTPSVSEFAAHSAAGEGARLLGPRIALGPVTCALATSEAAR